MVLKKILVQWQYVHGLKETLFVRWSVKITIVLYPCHISSSCYGNLFPAMLRCFQWLQKSSKLFIIIFILLAGIIAQNIFFNILSRSVIKCCYRFVNTQMSRDIDVIMFL